MAGGDGGVVPLPPPLRRHYDDLDFTWANILPFRSEEAVDDRAGRPERSRGKALKLGKAWGLSPAWYGDRLSPDYGGRAAEEAGSIFGGLGLTGPFWSP